ncbi:MAG: hypothetical protein JWO36_6688 [Myxococcales bacterium]|nr:hypothetical protein [Myxococcales bacterium]
MRARALTRSTVADAAVADGAAIADADSCAGVVTNGPVAGCVQNGLASLSLDGMWTLTGTISSFGGGMGTLYSATMWMARSGSGRCVFEIASAPITVIPRDSNVYIDDTFAFYSSHTFYPHTHTLDWQLCVSATDGTLIYREHETLSMPMRDTTIDGVLTR